MDIPARVEEMCAVGEQRRRKGRGGEQEEISHFRSNRTFFFTFRFAFFFLWTSFFLKKRENFQLKKQPSSDPMVEARKKHNTEILPALTQQRSKKKISRNIPKKTQNWSSQQHIYLIWNEISSERSQHQHLEPFSFAPKCGLSEWVNHLFRMHHGRQRCVCTSEESSPAPHK